MLKDILSKGEITTLSVEVPDVTDTGQPRELTADEAEERIIKLAEALKGDHPDHS